MILPISHPPALIRAADQAQSATLAPPTAAQPAHLGSQGWEIAKEISERFHRYAKGGVPQPKPPSAHPIRSLHPVQPSPSQLRVQHYHAMALGMQRHLQQAERSTAYQHYASIGKRIWKWVQQYHPYAVEKNGKYVLRTMVNGVPVIPPGMTGAQLQQFIDHRAIAMQQKHATTIVFISESMPGAILKRMFADDWKDKNLRTHTVFVLRGWPPEKDGMQVLVSRLYHLFPSQKKQPTVEINPTLFTGHRVTRVPVVIHRIPHTKKWSAIIGDGYGLIAAVHRIDQGKGSLHHLYGRTWKIAEPSLIDLIKQRAKVYDWKAEEARAQRQNLVAMSHTLAVHLPESRHPLNYLWDPAVVAQKTMVLPDGQVVVHAGQRINPLRYFPQEITHAYALFNPRKKWQVQDVMGWLSVYRNLLIMATSLPSRPSQLRALDQQLHHFVYASSPLLAYRLGIRAVPSLVTLSHYRLHIQVPAIPRLSPPHRGGKPS